MKSTILEVKNLTTEFQTGEFNVRAVNDVSFSLDRGEILGIVGESGSGKSVTALSVMRLIQTPPGHIKQGQILFWPPGKPATDLLSLTENQLRTFRGRHMSMIFQEPMTSLNPVMTCGKQVMEVILLHEKISSKQAKQKTIQLFNEVRLPKPAKLFSAYPHQLSGGQKQRIMIAMAICCNPSLLIADEPTTALDVTVQKTILELIRSLRQKYGMSVIFISHDLGVIAQIADKAAVMYNGKIVEYGTVHRLFNHPRHPYTRGLLACRPPLNLRLRSLPTVGEFLNHEKTAEKTGENKEINEVLIKLAISPQERMISHENLYRQMPLLQIKNVKTYFPVQKGMFGRSKEFVKAVDAIDLEVFPGETLGLVGESGCGKTTLGRTILRLIEATHGEIYFKGININDLPPGEMRKIRSKMQIIFQDPYSSLNPRIAIGSAIMEPMRVLGLHNNEKKRHKKAFELLQKVNIPGNFYNRYPHELSGGQRQRVCIARALTVNPEFIICDECVSSLDVSIQAQVLNLLNDLKKEFDLTYIFISHDLSVVKFMSDRIAVMKEGKILEMNEADLLYSHPGNEYTRKLIEAVPVFT